MRLIQCDPGVFDEGRFAGTGRGHVAVADPAHRCGGRKLPLVGGTDEGAGDGPILIDHQFRVLAAKTLLWERPIKGERLDCVINGGDVENAVLIWPAATHGAPIIDNQLAEEPLARLYAAQFRGPLRSAGCRPVRNLTTTADHDRLSRPRRVSDGMVGGTGVSRSDDQRRAQGVGALVQDHANIALQSSRDKRANRRHRSRGRREWLFPGTGIHIVAVRRDVQVGCGYSRGENCQRGEGEATYAGVHGLSGSVLVLRPDTIAGKIVGCHRWKAQFGDTGAVGFEGFPNQLAARPAPGIIISRIGTGRSVARLARLLGVQEVASSNLAAPTI